jgi:hypothetical protein
MQINRFKTPAHCVSFCSDNFESPLHNFESPFHKIDEKRIILNIGNTIDINNFKLTEQSLRKCNCHLYEIQFDPTIIEVWKKQIQNKFIKSNSTEFTNEFIIHCRMKHNVQQF